MGVNEGNLQSSDFSRSSLLRLVISRGNQISLCSACRGKWAFAQRGFMWLCSGLLYMLCLLITPVSTITLDKPQWLQCSSLTSKPRPSGSSFMSFMLAQLFFESSSLLPLLSLLRMFRSLISEAR